MLQRAHSFQDAEGKYPDAARKIKVCRGETCFGRSSPSSYGALLTVALFL
jgi:hypothetical protein